MLSTKLSLVEFLQTIFSSEWIESFLASLEALSPEEFYEELLKHCSKDKHLKERFLISSLNRSEAILLILRETIRHRIEQTEKEIKIGLKKDLFVGTCILGSKKSNTRSQLNLKDERVRIDKRSLKKVSEELDRRVAERLVKPPAFFSNDRILKNKANFAYKVSGYIFHFYEGYIFLINWYPPEDSRYMWMRDPYPYVD